MQTVVHPQFEQLLRSAKTSSSEIFAAKVFFQYICTKVHPSMRMIKIKDVIIIFRIIINVFYPPRPAKPINESDKIPANSRVNAVPFAIDGTSASSSCSLNPAIKISASVNPAPAPIA